MRRIASLSLLLLLSATAAFAASEDTIKRGFNVGDGGTLTLDADVGDIKVVAGGSGVAVEIHRKARNADDLKEHEVTFSQNGNDVTIKGDRENRHSWFGINDWNFDVQWNIRVPKNYNVKLHTSGGDIDLSDIDGTADARTSGGDISAGRIGGPASLQTSGGDIDVKLARGNVLAKTSGGDIDIGDTTGEVEARTSGGSITLTRVGGDVLAKTSGGNIRVDEAYGSVDANTSGGSITARLARQPKGDSRLTTSGGSVTVSLASGIGVDLDAQSSGGDVVSDVPLTVQGKVEDDSIRGRVGGGGPKLVLRSSGGGVRVKPM